MTKARIQRFCTTHIIDIGCFNGKEIYRRSIVERIKAISLYIYHFCLIWKSDNLSCTKAIKELKSKYKIVNNSLLFDKVK